MKKFLNFINKNKYIILLILIYLIFFIQMQQIFFYGDDFQVLYPIHKSKNFFNILNYSLQLMNFFWNEWSGRIVGHFTVSFGLSIFGIQFFRILNPIMVFIMIYLCLKILSLFKKFDFCKYLFFLSIIILGTNIFISRETIYWSYSGILYIWGFNLTLSVIYFTYKYYINNAEIPIYLLVILGFLCFLQTFILEQLSFMLISFLFLILISRIKKIYKIQPYLILFLITVLGFLISSFAPGNVARTKPLVQELVNYQELHIILGKILWFLNYIFDPKICGIYFSFLMLLINKNYMSKVANEKKKFLKKVPSIIVISYFLLFLFSNLFNIDIFNFAQESDTLHSMYALEYFLSINQMNKYNINLIVIIARIVYLILLLASTIYMLFKTIWKQNKFLFFSIPITLIAALIPIVCIRFIGSRYYMFFIMATLIVAIYYILSCNEKNFDLKFILLYSFILPYKYAISISLLIFILLLINDKICNKFLEKSNFVIKFIIIFLCTTNVVSAIYGYNKNKNFYILANEKLKNALPNSVIELEGIPDKYYSYTWHSIIANYNADGTYYGIYLNDFYQNYYNIDLRNVFVKNKKFKLN